MHKSDITSLPWSHARKVSDGRIIYVCSPFAGDMETNAKKAEIYSRFVWRQGGIPVTPHLLFTRFMDDTDASEREAGLKMARCLMVVCDEVWTFSDRISAGMAAEIAEASRRSIPIYHVDDSIVLQSEVRECGI